MRGDKAPRDPSDLATDYTKGLYYRLDVFYFSLGVPSCTNREREEKGKTDSFWRRKMFGLWRLKVGEK